MRKFAAIAALAGVGVALVLISMMSSLFGDASSHREAPFISTDPSADTTDVYVFISPDKPDTVTLIGNWIPFEEPGGGPNFFKFDDNVLYALRIDNDGDATEDITYEFRFTTQRQNPNTFLYNTGPIDSLDSPNWNVRQAYNVTRVDDGGSNPLGENLATPPVNIGPASTPNYEALAAAAVHDLGNGVTVFAGQRDDPFFADVAAIFDLLTIRPGVPGNAGGGKDTLGGFNVHTIAIQVPISQLTSNGSAPAEATDPAAVIGVWATSSRPTTSVLSGSGEAPQASGDLVQVSRLGSPLVNEAVIPLGLKDRWNASQPRDDGQFLSFVTDPELAKLLNLLYGVNVPPAPRNDLVSVFLTGVEGLTMPANIVPSEQLRLNVAVPPADEPNPLGVLAGDNAGFPNGRRLVDDVYDIEVRAVAGVLVGDEFNVAPNNQLGDGVDANDLPFLEAFPYVGTPHEGFENIHGAGGAENSSGEDDDDNMGLIVVIVVLGVLLGVAVIGGAFFAMRRA